MVEMMILTNVVSPHTIPLAVEIAHLVRDGEFIFAATGHITEARRRLGWADEGAYPWIQMRSPDESLTDFFRRMKVSDVKFLLTNLREWNVVSERTDRGFRTGLFFERWFKPIRIAHIKLPGCLRLLHPAFLRMSRRFVRLSSSELVTLFPMGIPAAEDIVRLVHLLKGDLRYLYKRACLDFEAKPGGCVDGYSQMKMLSYFVADDAIRKECVQRTGPLKVLWVGRMLNWKRVDTIIRAVSGDQRFTLDLYGAGPEEAHLKRLAGKASNVNFCTAVPIREVRRIMREHDVYVLSSDEGEGWGAALNEAMLARMAVIGTYEAGSSATIIRNGVNGLLYRAGDVEGVLKCLEQCLSDEFRTKLADEGCRCMSTTWSPRSAAAVLCNGSCRSGNT